MDATTLEMIPVRALNQVSYCPRLYYLEYVESVMPINEFVEEAKASGLVQRAIDRAGPAGARVAPAGDPN